MSEINVEESCNASGFEAYEKQVKALMADLSASRACEQLWREHYQTALDEWNAALAQAQALREELERGKANCDEIVREHDRRGEQCQDLLARAEAAEADAQQQRERTKASEDTEVVLSKKLQKAKRERGEAIKVAREALDWYAGDGSTYDGIDVGLKARETLQAIAAIDAAEPQP